MPDHEDDVDNLETSQLDVISCGLGGAALLAIVFSIVKDTPPVELSAPRFVKVVFACDHPKSQFDIVIQPPPSFSGEKVIRVSDFFSPSGVPIPGSSFPIEGAGTFRVRSVASDDQVLLMVLESGATRTKGSATVGTANHVVYSIDVYNPVEGEWVFDLLYRSLDTDEWDRRLPGGENAPEVKVAVLTQVRQETVKVGEPRIIKRIGERLLKAADDHTSARFPVTLLIE
jgi:hypothetical protein